MPARPHPAGRQPPPGSRRPSQVLADNVRALREHHGRSQAWLAELMRAQGEEWTQSTVSQVELGTRHVNINELFALALALELTDLLDLLDPLTEADKEPWGRRRGVPTRGREGGEVDLGVAKPLPGEFVHLWLDRRLSAIRVYVGADGETHLFSGETSVTGVDGEPLP
jgi:transcriptional regulator with XRE-family HTH domain